MSRKILRSLFFFAILGLCTASASAVVLFSDNFNSDSSGAWTQNKAPLNFGPPDLQLLLPQLQQAQFAFDYSAFGIPPAPGSGDTLGLRLRANLPIAGGVEVTTQPGGVSSGLSLSPTGQNFGANYKMTVYAWSNFFGAPNLNGLADNLGSEGGTNNVMFAIGTSGTVPVVVANTGLVLQGQMDGIGFATTGDGALSQDYRVYPKSGAISTIASGVYSAGSTQNTDPFYTALFPPVTAPAVQQSIAATEYPGDAFNPQLGSTEGGSFGFAWHQVEITKLNNSVAWKVDGTTIANIDISALSLGGNNIALGVSDPFSSTARHPSLVFTVFDNLVISDVASVPEPSTMLLLLSSAACFASWSVRRRS